MKQTAVEWLEKICNNRGYHLMSEYFEQAKEMEKQQSYSEEDMIAFGEFIFKHSLLTHTRGVKSLFEQFKNK